MRKLVAGLALLLVLLPLAAFAAAPATGAAVIPAPWASTAQAAPTAEVAPLFGERAVSSLQAPLLSASPLSPSAQPLVVQPMYCSLSCAVCSATKPCARFAGTCGGGCE
jgi:hypothetical protein